jgi:hypothetical protein
MAIMKFLTIVVMCFMACLLPLQAQTILAAGEQPQITVDNKGLVRLVFGDKDKIYFSISNDQGKTFSKPSLIGQVSEMHLGMTRGPQLASSKDYSIVTAMDKKGNIHSFRLTHKSGNWEKIKNVNDLDASAPEGLMSVSADDQNNFYAVWLDSREEKKNNICVSILKDKTWSKNEFAYKSPESHVCECCKPSIAVNGYNVSIMFRNWLKGSRDLYLISSLDAGQTFSEAQKLGNGTWSLKGCPMDGGGLTVDSNYQIHTAWQREGQVYYSQPGQGEQKIGDGRGVGLSGDIVSWENSSQLFIQPLNGGKQKVGEGTALKLFEFPNKTILAVWEKDDHIVFKIL